MTQADAARAYTDHLDKPMSVASWSILEAGRARQSNRIRIFDADELVALCAIFDKPLLWWFVPPHDALGQTWEATGESLVAALYRARGASATKDVIKRWKDEVGVGAVVVTKLDKPPAGWDTTKTAVVLDIGGEKEEYAYIPTEAHPIWSGAGVFIGYFLEDPADDGGPPEGAIVYASDGAVIGKISAGEIEHGARAE